MIIDAEIQIQMNRPRLPNLAGYRAKATAGSEVHAHIMLMEILHEGVEGDGDTYKATITGTQNSRFCAVKCFPIHERDLVQREGVLQKLVSNHQGIPTAHYALLSDQYIFLVMDLVEGLTLSHAVTHTSLSASGDAVIKPLILQLIDILQHCHSKGVFHRNIRSQDIIVSKDFTRLYLTNFHWATKDPKSVTSGSCTSPYASYGRQQRHQYFLRPYMLIF